MYGDSNIVAISYVPIVILQLIKFMGVTQNICKIKSHYVPSLVVYLESVLLKICML